MNTKKVCSDFERKKLTGYHDLYLQSDPLLLADAFENIRKLCLKISELNPANFLSAKGLAWETALKKTKVELRQLTKVDMLLMVEKEIRGGIYNAIQKYVKANNKYMKDYDKK